MCAQNKFIFSQHNLQDFVDCPRRFELKYLMRLNWPSPISNPIQQHQQWTDRGTTFHSLAHAFFCGISKDQILSSIRDNYIKNWFINFTEFLDKFNNSFFWWSEKKFNSKFYGFTFTSIFDAITCLEDGSLLILDWKTSKKIPRKEYMAATIQTILYPCILYSNQAAVEKQVSTPIKQLEMIYWFSEFPDQPIKFEFSQKEIELNTTKLSDLALKISQLKLGEFKLTDDLKKCSFCIFRSLCNRGSIAGNLLLDETSTKYESEGFELSFDDITDVEF